MGENINLGRIYQYNNPNEGREIINSAFETLENIERTGTTQVWEVGAGAYSTQTVGTGCMANGEYSVAEGIETVTNGDYSHIEGSYNIEYSGFSNHVEGNGNILSNGIGCHIEGLTNIIYKDKYTINDMDVDNKIVSFEGDITSVFTEGIKMYIPVSESGGGIQTNKVIELTTVSSSYNLNLTEVVIIEDLTIAYNNYNNYAFTIDSTLIKNIHIEGSSNIIKNTANHSHVEGSANSAEGQNSHVEGGGVKAIGTASHAEGKSTTAEGDYSHSEGSLTKAIGSTSHSEGVSTFAIGNCSHAQGQYTQSSGNCSHVQGYKTIANDFCEYVGGQSNIISTGSTTDWIETDSLFVLGNGTGDETRSNAFQIKKNGNTIIGGSVKIGTDSTSASANNVGTIRYRLESNKSCCEMVMQTGAATYYWVSIKQNTW